MTTGFRDNLANFGVTVGTGAVKGIVTPGPLTFAESGAGYEVEIDQSVEVFATDLTALGLSLAGLPASCAARAALIVDGVTCRLIAFSNESSDPTVKLYLKIGR